MDRETFALPHRPKPTGTIEHVKNVLCVHLDIGFFKPGAKSMRDLHNFSRPVCVAKALSVFAHIVSNPALAHEGYTPGGKDNERLPYNFLNSEDNRCWCTTQYLEVVQAEDRQVTGYRFWILVHDPGFEMPRGVVNTWLQNRCEEAIEARKPTKEQRQLGVWGVDQLYRHLNSEQIWAFTIADSYIPGLALYTKKTDVCDGDGILQPTNDACPLVVFSVQHAMELADRGSIRSCVEQRTAQRYTVLDGEMRIAGIRFPFPNLVFPIDSDVFHTRTVLAFQLPKARREDGEPEEAEEDNGRRASAEVALHTHIHGFAPPAMLVGQKLKSDLIGLADDNKAAWIRADSVKEQAARLEAIRAFRHKAFDDFVSVYDSRNHLSEPLKAMLRWNDENYRVAFETNTEVCYSRSESLTAVVDHRLSSFANMCIRRMNWFENELQTSVVHRELFLTSVGRLDTYRRAFKLHLNWLLSGGGGTGKSFVVTNVANMCIPGTFVKITHKTNKADAIESDANDVIELYEEATRQLLGMEYGDTATTGDPTIKEKLCSQKYVSKVFHMDPDTGVRSNRTITSECIGTIGACTNDPIYKIPEALRSRFLILICPSVNRAGRNIIDYMSTGQSERRERARELVFESLQTEQFLVATYNKLVAVKALPEPNMEVACALWHRIIEELGSKGIAAHNEARAFIRLNVFARTLTVLHAIEMVFHTPGQEAYGLPFTFEHFKRLTNYLVCSEEIAFFAITMLKSQWMNDNESILVDTLARKKCNYPPSVGWDNHSAGVNENGDPPDTVQFRLKENVVRSQSLPLAQKYDFNYLEFTGTISDIAATASTGGTSALFRNSQENNMHLLKMMMSRTIKTYPRIGPLPGDVDFEGGLQEIPIFQRAKDGKHDVYYLAVDWVLEVTSAGHSDKMINAIRNTFHKHTVSRPLLLGETWLKHTHGNQTYICPNLFKVIHAVPNGQKLFRIENDIARSSADEPDHYLADDNVEDIFYEKAMQDFGHPMQEEYYPSVMHQTFRARFADANTREYPKAYLESVRRRRRAREDESDISHQGQLFNERYALSSVLKRPRR